MKVETVLIPVTEKESVSAVLALPDTPNRHTRTGLIFAHGAANDMHHPLIAAVAEGLAGDGFLTLRFNFLYREKGKKSPDSQGKLVQTWQRVHAWLKKDSGHRVDKIIAVGKSMGGRVASQMAADGQLHTAGMIFLGYPLHAPGRKDQLKDRHLYRIEIPLLFFAGTRDPLCDLTQLDGVLANLNCPYELEIVKGGDHSFKLPKSDSRGETDIHALVLEKCRNWLKGF
jgi:predicted alpha/beta-hydrolase family hydrolase